MKPKIFIGSSSEKISLLKKVKKQLKPIADIVAWTDENAFTLNRSALDSLVKQARVSDFAILIATKDDIIKIPSRSLTKQAPRDNIIFEFGLFLGAISLDRAYLLAEDGIDLPSDLNGITVLSFTTNPKSYNFINKQCRIIINNIIKFSEQGELGFVPSTALAIGYYNSYIKRLCEELGTIKKIIYNDNELQLNSIKLNVILPEVIDETGVIDFFNRFIITRKLVTASTLEKDPSKRSSAFYFKIDIPTLNSDGKADITIYDVPSTINTIGETLKIYYPLRTIGKDKDRDHLEKRELLNFANVLKYFIGRSVWTNDSVVVEESVII
ncbi:TIR domain-containing protein [Spirosoma sp. 48-14]|mgnify:CR=1 FL=1|uniref:TIR domain-containing protein n=1 Tax=Spirosoma sp. 48-14 TaxID=1895854 RepID=UPI0009641693|nr:TIR domain-containing protein [Spirosoma sp. 48-14]OJW77876.1 MAG: hypothetical protein BGO59_23970 [Spirosoma sp. 48-14]